MVMLYIKLKGMTHASNNFVLKRTLDPLGGVKRSKQFFSLEVIMLYIELKGIKTYNKQAIILSLNKPSTPGMGSRGQNSFFLKKVILHINLKGMKRKIAFFNPVGD